MTREEERNNAAFNYISSEAVNSGNEKLAFGDFINGVKWADEHPSKEVKKEMITRAIAWVEWNNRNGSCLFDGWKESLRKTMEFRREE